MIPAVDVETRARQLESAFSRIHRERMNGLPFLNSALDVKAVGFHDTDQGTLGVLITPWFMNLILLPNQDADTTPTVGSKITHSFASGNYEFTAGYEPDVGAYQMCSLFSPMTAFADQAAAVATAEEAIGALMVSENREQLGFQSIDPEPGLQPAELQSGQQHRDAPKAISRRALLRGRLGHGTQR